MSQFENTKTQVFRGPTIYETLDDIQRELGEDALVVSVREIPSGSAWQVWKAHSVEVIAMRGPSMDSAAMGVNTILPRPAALSGPAASFALEDIRSNPPLKNHTQDQSSITKSMGTGTAVETSAGVDKLIQLTRQLKAAQGAQREDSFEHPAEEETSQNESLKDFDCPALKEARFLLAEQGVDPELIEKVLKTTQDTLGPRSLAKQRVVNHYIMKQLKAGLRAANSTRLGQDRVMFLIGKRGSGKTSTLAKLAAYTKRDLKKKVRWICADTVKAGSIAEAKIYAELLNVPLDLVYTADELRQVITNTSADEVVFVDTPGCNPYLEQDVLQLGSLLTALPERTTYLLSPATTKENDLKDFLAAVKPFKPSFLILTKLDETGTYGNVYNFAWRSGIPLAYFTSGPDVLDDLRPANPNRLAGAIMGEMTLR